MPELTRTTLLVTVGAVIVVAGLVALAGLAVATRLGVGAHRSAGRTAALAGLGAVGALAALTGSLFQGYTVRVGGTADGLTTASGGSSALAADVPRAAGSGGSGFDFPLGALLMLAVFAAVLFYAARCLRAPVGVGVPAAAWLIVVALLMYGGDGKGDVILPAAASAQIYFFGGLVLATGFLVPAYQYQLSDRLGQRKL